uniref:RWD domain-containing protein n=1 Tax=Globisporangium ultimum (strain ATCC 200006 / CBS 805.95 / DAOM BR144) TaxID=431595 RepID=K3X4E1_GLOUD
MEVEALESIYMDEFKPLTQDPLSYQIHIVPNQDGQNNHVALTLKCMIPETYPDVEPKIDVVLDKGLSDTQHKEIVALLKEQIQENVGMAMVFTLCEAVREYLVENNHKGNDGSEYQDMLRRLEIKKKKDDKDEADKLEQAEADDSEKKSREFVGTAVTVESFAIWLAKFEAEMRGTQKVSLKDESTAKLTGKQLWAKGLAGDDDGDTSTIRGEDGENDDEDDDDDEDYEDGDEEDDDEDDN